ncbi:MAG: fatty acid desaturase [Paludibacter sp.]|nr:fatty acid desaturase [Paludibacter sp.]
MGVFIALIIIVSWIGHLVYVLTYQLVDVASITFWFHILIQAWLSTGLFITAHDAMHGTVSNSKALNTLIGRFSTFLYAGMGYRKLLACHIDHHNYSATDKDPDYSVGSQQFMVWWFRFMIRYVTVWQMLIMALLFNVLLIWYNELQLLLFWVVPLFLSTFQLFYFGTYLPHKLPHTTSMGEHRSRTLTKNHVYAFVSCYFFGYHFEHHTSPQTPWWRLYQLK